MAPPDSESPLRILLLISARKWIGEAAHAVALARGLRRAGHEATLGVRGGFEVETRAREAGLEPMAFHFNSRFDPRRDLSDYLRIRALARGGRIDLVHCHRGKDHWLAAAALLGADVPLARTRHVVTPARQSLVNRWLYASATQGLISVSRQARASLGDLARRVNPASNAVIYSAVDAGVFAPAARSAEIRRDLGAEEGDALIGLVGRLQRVKGQRHFLKAAALLAREIPNVRFLIAGRGSQSQANALWDFARSVGLSRENLCILGTLPNLPAVMASLDIGAVASVGSEGSSRVTLEYMASGLPVVATKVGGIPELLSDGREGFLVEPRDAEGMSRRLAELVRDPGLRRAMGAAGRRAAQERHDPEQWIAQIVALYRAALALPRPCERGR